MKHFLNLDAANYLAVSINKRPFLLLKLKREAKPGDELVIENKTDESAPQLTFQVHETTKENGLMKGWQIITIKQLDAVEAMDNAIKTLHNIK